MRDTQLDIYRALTMMYIVCIIHVLYWFRMGGEPFKSIALFEMSVVFFISGASLSIKKTERGFFATLWNRIKRVLLPYYLYAFVLLTLGALWLLAKEGMHANLSYRLLFIKMILFCEDIPRFPYIWHLWFILPYLILSCTFGVQIKLMKHMPLWLYVAGCIVVFLVSERLSAPALWRYVFCYNIFMVGGYLCYKRLSMIQLLIVAVTAAIVLFVVKLLGASLTPMQTHKFPPDYVFVVYNIFALSSLSLVIGKLTPPSWRIIDIWNRRGYTIYLYQSLVFTIVFPVHSRLVLIGCPYLLHLTADILMVFVLSTALSYVTFPLEKAFLNLIGQKNNHE